MRAFLPPLALLVILAASPPGRAQTAEVHIVPNTHGTVAGWLVDFDTERNYVLNNYLEHLRLASQVPGYRFVWSEVPNLISLFELEPARLDELRARLRAGQVELVNALFLEADLSLPSGETLARLGVEGIRWQQEVFGLRPRFLWAIDITGAHRQLPQLAARLGLEAVVFTRNNPVGRTAFWWRAPDGSRALAITAPHYMELQELFRAEDPRDPEMLAATTGAIEERLAYSPLPELALFLAGASDYSLPPAMGLRLPEFFEAWRSRQPRVLVRFSTMSQYLAALQTRMRLGAQLPEYSGDVAYCFNGFWADLPEVKRTFRRTEHLIRAAEMMASAASICCRRPYPARRLGEAWLLLLLNSDRNAIWGAGAGPVFRSADHWNVWDRFEGAQQRLEGVLQSAVAVQAGGPAVVNPLNWERSDPFRVRLPAGRTLAGAVCQESAGTAGEALCQLRLPPAQAAPVRLAPGPADAAAALPAPKRIHCRHYQAEIDLKTGEISALFSASGKPVLRAGSGRFQLESAPETIGKVAADFMAPKRQRTLLPSCGPPQAVQARDGALAIVVEARLDCPEFELKRRIWFYHQFPRIDFEIELDLRRSDVLATVDFSFAGRVRRRTRGIPFGFSEGPPEEGWLQPQPYFLARAAEHHLFGYSAALLPAAGWSDYRLADGGGLTLIDDGLPMHEFAEDRLTLGLVNAVSTYRGLPNEELKGVGRHSFRFALLPHEGDWRAAESPRRAREFQSEPLWIDSGAPLPELIRTSANLMLEAVRREGRDLEVRLTEWRGEPAMAWVECLAPHRGARRTNLLGEDPRPLGRSRRYRFAVLPQEIVTLRFELEDAVEAFPALRSWETVVPEARRKGLRMRLRATGHPPRPF